MAIHFVRLLHIMREERRAMEKLIRMVVDGSIEKCLPDNAVKKELKNLPSNKGRKILIAIGKAAYQMAKTALESDVKFDDAVVITKYDHLTTDLEGAVCFEAGHPISDDNTIKASKYAYDLVKDLSADDLVVMLISGGGSALFEIPVVDFSEIQDINNQLLEKGANIIEINTIRKRLSKLKGGKFAEICKPATVYNIILSDVVGNRPDMIASGPTYVDQSTCKEALNIVKKYDLSLSDEALKALEIETVKELDNSIINISGSVDQLCLEAKSILEKEGYDVDLLTTSLDSEAKEVGNVLSAIARYQSKRNDKKAYIFGGETVVYLKGKGLGGRNQELAFASAKGIANLDNVTIISYSSDGTDGPTDAAGAYVDGNTMAKLEKLGINFDEVLANNDSYTALEKIGQLIKTGPTGTNVNDCAIILIN